MSRTLAREVVLVVLSRHVRRHGSHNEDVHGFERYDHLPELSRVSRTLYAKALGRTIVTRSLFSVEQR
jgi:hypothetical protein